MKNKTKKQINALRVLIVAVATLSMMSCNQKPQSSDEATSVESQRPKKVQGTLSNSSASKKNSIPSIRVYVFL